MTDVFFPFRSSSQDLSVYSAEEKRDIFHALGQVALDDVDTKWVKDMAAASVSANVVTELIRH